MKFRAMFKCPDALEYAIKNAVSDCKNPQEEAAKIEKQFAKFFRYGEYVDLECDTETGTVTVLSNQ